LISEFFCEILAAKNLIGSRRQKRSSKYFQVLKIYKTIAEVRQVAKWEPFKLSISINVVLFPNDVALKRVIDCPLAFIIPIYTIHSYTQTVVGH